MGLISRVSSRTYRSQTPDMSWGPTTFKVLKNAPAGKNPALVFGPDLLSNLQALQNKPQHLQAIPDKVSAEKTSNVTCKNPAPSFGASPPTSSLGTSPNPASPMASPSS